jgi:hypothetical protein
MDLNKLVLVCLLAKRRVSLSISKTHGHLSLPLSPAERAVFPCSREKGSERQKDRDRGRERERQKRQSSVSLSLSLSLCFSLSLSLFLSLCLLIKETDRKELLLPYVERRGPPQVDLRRLLQADSNAKEFLSAC